MSSYFCLAAQLYAREASAYLRELDRTRNESRRRWLRRQIERARSREAWHVGRLRAGAPVPAAVARHASLARHWLKVAREAQRDVDRAEALERFRAALRAAGDALAANEKAGMKPAHENQETRKHRTKREPWKDTRTT